MTSDVRSDGDPVAAEHGARELASLLEQVRRNAVELLAGIDPAPRTLLVRAGAIVVEIEWQPGDRPAADAAREVSLATVDDGADYLTAPTVGVFYRAPEPGAEPFVHTGDTVRTGQQVGIIEAMKLMIPVEADRGGRIAEVLKADGESVEYGEPIFALHRDGD
jgi:acetyl-CoA carboxylase biotin carboxyl carrier protein